MSLPFVQSLYKGLTDLLEFEGNVEETFMQTFMVSYKDVFGNTITKELKDKGDELPVTNDNREVSDGIRHEKINIIILLLCTNLHCLRTVFKPKLCH